MSGEMLLPGSYLLSETGTGVLPLLPVAPLSKLPQMGQAGLPQARQSLVQQSSPIPPPAADQRLPLFQGVAVLVPATLMFMLQHRKRGRTAT